MVNLYTWALNGTVVLGIVVLMLCTYALVTRRISEIGQSRAARLRPRMHKAVEGWLEGRIPLDKAGRLLDQDPKLATGVLLDIASTRDSGRQLPQLAQRLQIEPNALQTLGRRNPAKRARAAIQLGYLGTETAVPALIQALQDEQLDVRLAAAQALTQMRHAPAVVPVLDSLALPGRWPLQRATELLVGFGRVAIAPLRAVLGARNSGQNQPVAVAVSLNVLGMLGAREATPEAIDWLEHSEPEIRVAAARALGGMGERAAVPALARALRDEEWEIRSMAAKSLGLLRDASAVPALEHALTDKAWWVRFNAAQALAEIGTSGIDALRRALDTEEDAFARDISRQLLAEISPRAEEVTS